MKSSSSITKNVLIEKLSLLSAIGQSQRIILLTVALAGSACIAHLILGASVSVTCIAFLTFLLSFYPIYTLGFLNLGSVLIALVGFRYVGFPLFAKLAFGQALDTNLFDPLGSFGITLIGVIGYFVAFQAIRYIPIGKPLLSPHTGYRFLTRTSLLAAIIGITANIMVAMRINEEYNGIRVANFFVSFLHLALISAVARIVIKSKGRRSIDLWVIILIAIEIEFAMIFNSRMAIMESILCWAVTSISFEAKLRWKHILATVCAIILMVTIITPVFFYFRGFRSDLSWVQRTNYTLKTLLQWDDTIDYHMDWKELTERFGWHRSYYGRPNTVFERMSHINDADILKNGTDTNGNVGIKDLYLSFKRILPRFLSPNKPLNYGHGSWLIQKIGISDPGPYPCAPLIGNGYVVFGWIGSFLYPFFLGIGWLSILKIVAGFNLQNNIWGIYFLLRCHNQFVEGSSDAYLEHIIRNIPQDFFLLYIVSILANGQFIYHSKKKYL